MSLSPSTAHDRRPRRTAYLAALVALLVGLTSALGAGAASAASKPGRPTGVVGIGQDAAATLTWTAPSDGGAAITEYRVRSSSNGGSTWATAVRTRSAATTFTITGLTNGTSYVFQVRATNRVGSGRWSAVSAAVTPVAATHDPVAPDPAPQDPAPQDPTPQDPAPQDPAPQDPTPQDPAPQDPAPQDPTPQDPVAPGSWWAPAKGTSWQWQLTGTIDTSIDAAVFDIDGEDNSASTVSALHARGAKVICYFSAGSWEDWRNDAGAFPASVKGKPLDGWAGENWLDVRQLDVLLPIMEARIATCAKKGFDAVEPDNVDGYTNATGFPLTAADQAAYNRALADLAHKHGLGVALKNDPDQVRALEPYFDFSVAEECARYNECAAYAPFTAAGKAVLHVEYKGTLDSFCPTTAKLGFSSMLKKLNLDAWRSPCP